MTNSERQLLMTLSVIIERCVLRDPSPGDLAEARRLLTEAWGRMDVPPKFRWEAWPRTSPASPEREGE